MEFQGRQSIYIQIADFICENILSGKWKSGDKIPSIREMAADIGVNPNTVMRTYTHLQEKEIIENQRGIGFFIGEASYRNVLEMKREEFLGKGIPVFFKHMQLLGISFNNLEKYFEEFEKQKESKL